MRTKITKKEMINNIIEYTEKEMAKWFAVDNCGFGMARYQPRHNRFAISYSCYGLGGDFYVDNWQDKPIDYVFTEWACNSNIQRDNRNIFTDEENTLLDALEDVLIENFYLFETPNGNWGNKCHEDLMSKFNLDYESAFYLLQKIVNEITTPEKANNIGGAKLSKIKALRRIKLRR